MKRNPPNSKRRRSSRRILQSPSRGRWLGGEELERRELLTVTVEFQTTLGNFQVELFDDVAPRTVANFLNYVTSDRFDETFFHRSVPGFVIQGGGFSLSDNGFSQSVQTDAPVLNEFNRSNVRGTIAMAKLGGNPNSATSQFFFNLGNNASNLDNQNGGFTVFGQVLGNGMQIVDAIAAVPTFNVNSQIGGSAFTDTPLRNYTNGNAVTDANPIFVTNVSIVGNASPIVIPFSTTSVTVGEGQSLPAPTVVAEEYNSGSTLTYSLIDPPAGAQIDPETGVISWSPTAGQANQTFLLKVQATNSQGLSDTESFSVRVNDAPSIAPIDPRTVNEGSPVIFQLTGIDTDTPANSLTFAVQSGAPSGSSFDPSTRTFQWTPTETQGPGDYSVVFLVSDNTGLSSTQTVNIRVNEVNQAPVLAPIASRTLNRGETLTVVVSATDADLPANSLTYSFDEGSLPGAVFDPGTRTLTWTPQGSALGNFAATVRVVDGAGGSDFETFVVTVTRPNSAPTLGLIADQQVAEGELLTLNLADLADDADLPDEMLRFSLTQGPSGLVLGDGGALSFRPSEAQGPGVYPVTVAVADALGASATRSFNITVSEVPSAPVLLPLGDRTAQATRTLTLQPLASDADLPAQGLTYSLGEGAPEGASINPQTGAITWTPSEDQVGQEFTFQVTVTDGTGLSAAQSFAVLVVEAPKFDPAALLLSPFTFYNPEVGQSGARVVTGPALERITYPYINTTNYALASATVLVESPLVPQQAGAPNFTIGPDTGVAHIVRPGGQDYQTTPDKDGNKSKTKVAPTRNQQQTSLESELEADKLAALLATELVREATPPAGEPAEAAVVARDEASTAVFSAWEEAIDWVDRPLVQLPAGRVTGPTEGLVPPSVKPAPLSAPTAAPLKGAAQPMVSAAATTQAEARRSSDPDQSASAARALGAAAATASLFAPLLVTQLEERDRRERRQRRRRA